MGFLTAEKRATLEDPRTPLSDGFTLLDALGGGPPSYTGKRVNQRSARTFSAVYKAVALSSGWLGSIPCKLFRRRDDGGKDEERGHPAFDLLHIRPNPNMSASAYKEAKQGHLLTRGNGYSEIVFDRRGRPRELWPLPPDSTERVTRDGVTQYRTVIGGRELFLPAGRVLHIPGVGGDGVSGWSVVGLARQSIALGLAMEEFGARFFGNSSTPRGILTTDEVMSDTSQKRLKNQWEAAQGGLTNSHRVAVLEGGIKFQAIGLTAEDAQFIAGREFQVSEVARWFNLPPSKLGATRSEPRANVEQENIAARTDHLMPWATRWEQALTNQLLSDAEREAGLFFEFQLQGFERGDSQSRGNFYKTLFGIASITPNEVRAAENMNPIEGGDEPFVQMQDIPLSLAGQATLSDRALLAALETRDPEIVRAVVRHAELQAGEPRESALLVGPSREERSIQSRRRVRTQFSDLLLRDLRQLVDAEASDLRRAVDELLREGDPEAFISFLRRYYLQDGEFAALVAAIVVPTLRSFARAVWDALDDDIDGELDDLRLETFVAEYEENFVNGHAAGSRKQLEVLAAREGPDGVEARIDAWVDGDETRQPRALPMHQRELIALGEAAAIAGFAAGGVVRTVWRTVGEDCPMCDRLEGVTVSVSEVFVAKGQEFVGTDDETKIRPKRNISHPPLHGGCDCIVVPADG